ncbi:MAG: hypothetical protein HKM89_12080, partial [Gemmatimonadales bacterium]|nr:hypothetical protein [Gemmatimonadales bacterium]
VFGRDKAVLIYSPAEVHYLFPAPITRRQLIGYKLVRSQLLIVLNVAIFVLLFGAERNGLPLVARAVSLWVLFSTIHLHRIGASFVRTSLARHGWAGARRRVGSLIVIAVTLLAVVWSGFDALPEVRAALQVDLSTLFRVLSDIVHRPIPTAVLFPFRLVVEPFIASSLGEWGLALLPAVVILALHVVWVVRSDAAFEEASADASLERARSIETMRSGGVRSIKGRPVSPPIFRLAPEGWSGFAIVWKNLVAVDRAQHLRRMLVIAIFAAAIFFAMFAGREAEWAKLVSGLLVGWAAMWLLFGPLWVRNDLRSDLVNVDLLRTYPIGGRTVVAAEAASSAIVLTAAQLGLLLLATLASLGIRDLGLSEGARAALFVGAAVVLPAINLVGMLIQNGIALFFPAWVTLGPRRPSGVEALGQSMLVTVPYLLALAFALAGPFAVGYGAAVLLAPLLGFGSYVAGVIVLLLGAALEVFLIVEWLGGVYDRLDPSKTELAGAR